MTSVIHEAVRWTKRMRLAVAYRDAFESPQGQAVLHDILVRTGVLETSMTEGDPHMTAFKEGRRSVALDILAELRWTEGALLELARRQTNAQLAEDAA